MAKNLPIRMEDTTTVLSEDEKLAQEEAAAAEAEKKEAEESVYKEELNKLQKAKEAAEADTKRAEDIARQKSGAVEDEREKRKAAEALARAAGEALKDNRLSEEELEKKLDEKLNAREFNQKIKEVSQDPDEQALIKHHYETSIVKTGNVEADLAKAIAIANSHLVEQAKQQQVEREQNEALTAGYQGGRPTNRPGKPAYETNPTLRKAAELADRLGMGDAKKYLGK